MSSVFNLKVGNNQMFIKSNLLKLLPQGALGRLGLKTYSKDGQNV